MKKIIRRENRSVIINQRDGSTWANLYVNTREGIEKGDITTSRWEGKTIPAGSGTQSN